jgi:endogenous inhibitor of DNA gyrase (YacG/DUF329 family)
MAIINNTVDAILTQISNIVAGAPYSTEEATQAFQFQVRELLKEMAAEFAKPDVFGEWRKEVADVKDAAGIFLGELEWRFHHFECKCQGEITQWSIDEGRGFCPLCGKQMERVVRLLEVKKPEEEKAAMEKGEPAKFFKHSCPICGDSVWLEEGHRVEFCGKDGGKFQQAEWVDASGHSWNDRETFLKVTKDAEKIQLAFEMLCDALGAGLWNNRKESNLAIRLFVQMVLKTGTEHVEEAQFLAGMSARMDLLCEALEGFAMAFNTPVAKLFKALGGDAQGPAKMEQEALKVVEKMRHGFAVAKGGMTVLVTTDVLVRLGLCFFTGAVEGGVLALTLKGMNEDDAIQATFGMIKTQGFPALLVLRNLREFCTWGAEGVKA